MHACVLRRRQGCCRFGCRTRFVLCMDMLQVVATWRGLYVSGPQLTKGLRVLARTSRAQLSSCTVGDA